MSDSIKEIKEHSRGDNFTNKIKTNICKEEVSDKNPWLPKRVYWHGYPQEALIAGKSYTEVIWLLIKGELPDKEQAICFERLFTLLACPSPRSPQARAVMNAAISKTNFENWLPIGMNVANGAYGGALEIYESMRFIKTQLDSDSSPEALAKEKLSGMTNEHPGETIVAPGFGTSFGETDEYLSSLVDCFSILFSTDEMKWSQCFVKEIAPHGGWRLAGLVATILSALGFTAIQALGIFQMAIMPGLLAYADEKSGKPLTDMPFLGEEHYDIKMPVGGTVE